MPNVTLRDLDDLRIDDTRRGPVAGRGAAADRGGDFPERVRALLTVHGDELGLAAVPDGMDVVKDDATPAGRVVRYRETRAGIPVHGTEILVTADTSGRVRQLDLNLRPETAVADGAADAQITGKDAVARATAAVEGTPRLKVGAPEQMWFPVGGTLRLAYVVLVPTTEPVHDWEVAVDATTGEILSTEDLVVRAPDGSGLVFDPNPVVTAGTNALRDPAATPAGCGFAGTAQATIDAQRVTRTLRDLTLSGGTHKLDGPFCRIVNFGNPVTTIPEEATATAFTYLSNDERFEAVNVYYHVDSFQRYLQSLGITTAHNSRIDCDPHEGSGGAWFSPADGGLHFGDSGPCNPDRAEDGDVMIHEYGHAIQRNMVPTWGQTNPTTGRAETRAMGEGFGDILAALYFAEANGGFQREVFEDWIFAPGGLRRVDGTKVYPGSWVNQEHQDGEIWSAALWNAYRAMGGDSGTPATRVAARDALVKTVVLANTLIPGNGTMPQGAEALLRTNAALPEYRGVHCMALLDSFHARGLLPVDAGADLYISDRPGDAGAEATGTPFWNSPDLWIRNSDDNGSTHEPPEFGQDNWFYAKVTNRGAAPARAFVVTFNVKTFAGTQFEYPGDFVPPISAAVGFDLAPGASTVVKALWPASMVPAAGTHACWLASVHTPTGSTPSGRHVWESNNLAQKNLAVVDLVPGDSAVVPLQIGSLAALRPGTFRLEIVRRRGFKEVPVTVEHRDPKVIESIFGSVRGATAAERKAEVVGDGAKRSIIFSPGLRAGFPLRLKPRSPVNVDVRVEAPKTAKAGESFALDVLQRNKKGEIVGGVTVQVNVR